MILSRIIEHVKAQNWTAIAIDFVIVVMGVFVGLQVNNWNAARQERQLEAGYLAPLHDDFSRSIENADDNIDALEMQYRLAGIMMEQLRRCALDPAAKADFETGMYFFGRLEPPSLVTDTIEELKATGRMEIIKDLELRLQIAGTVRRQVSNAEVLGYVVARATPHKTYFDQRVVKWPPDSGLDVSSEPIPEGVLQYDFQALCADTKFLGSVSYLREATGVILQQNRQRKEDYLKVIDLLEAAP